MQELTNKEIKPREGLAGLCFSRIPSSLDNDSDGVARGPDAPHVPGIFGAELMDTRREIDRVECIGIRRLG